MSDVILGKTGIRSPKNGFGALPIQRVSKEYAAMLLRKAYDAGFTFLIRHGLIATARKKSDTLYQMCGIKLPLRQRPAPPMWRPFGIIWRLV